MDDDPVLRALDEALEHDDPRLAARMRGAPRHGPALMAAGVLAAVLVLLAAVALGPVVIGAVAVVLLVAAPIAVCRCTDCVDRLRPPEGPPDPR
ncbi:DUF3040 domain-containing protein [Geodermatophilus sp. SYSU D00815]